MCESRNQGLVGATAMSPGDPVREPFLKMGSLRPRASPSACERIQHRVIGAQPTRIGGCWGSGSDRHEAAGPRYSGVSYTAMREDNDDRPERSH